MQQNSSVAGTFIDKSRYQLFLCTLWSNLVLEPDQLDLEVEDLQQALHIVNQEAKKILGFEDSVTESFRFIASPAGEREMNQAKLPRNHRDMLTYFSSMILDPEGHRKWMEQVKQDNPRFR
jgi:hypothetical protein